MSDQSSAPQARPPTYAPGDRFVPVGDELPCLPGENAAWRLVPYEVGMPCVHAAADRQAGANNEK